MDKTTGQKPVKKPAPPSIWSLLTPYMGLIVLLLVLALISNGFN